jgi:hypothetical protein
MSQKTTLFAVTAMKTPNLMHCIIETLLERILTSFIVVKKKWDGWFLKQLLTKKWNYNIN